MRTLHGLAGPKSARLVRLLSAVGLALSLAVPAMPSEATSKAAEWRTLPLVEGGKISSDWVQIGWGGFAIEDGALRTDCDPRGLGLLVYRRARLGDCMLRVVFKVRDAKSNGGVYVRLAAGILDQVGRPGAAFDRNAAGKISKETMDAVKASAESDEGPWYAVHHGYEIQIADSGDALHRTGAVYSLAPSTATPRPGEWRTMLVTLAGERITVEIDGKRVTNFDPAAPGIPVRKNWPEPKREPARPIVGYIGLQNHDPGDVVWYKEVSVRPLPSSTERRD
jgi:hypothetical protein